MNTLSVDIYLLLLYFHYMTNYLVYIAYAFAFCVTLIHFTHEDMFLYTGNFTLVDQFLYLRTSTVNFSNAC